MRNPASVLALVLLGTLAAPLCAQPQPVADYRFNGDFTDSVGEGPDLDFLLPSDPKAPSEGTFIEEPLDGFRLPGWSYPAGTGFGLSTTDLIANDTYTVAILVAIDEPFGFVKLLDTRNLQLDEGLYARSEALRYYPAVSGQTEALPPGAVRQVVVTRAVDGSYVGYVDGVEQFVYADPSGGTAISEEQTLTFLRDDDVTLSENSAGVVLRIRLFDSALDAAEVLEIEADRIWLAVFDDGFE